MDYKKVTFIDRKTAYIDTSVQIGENTIIEPCVCIRGNTIIGKNVHIGMGSEISDCIIGDDVKISHSVILQSFIGEGTIVGPFAYIRPESKIGKNVKIGDFVEIKKSSIDDGTKISHLTYIGDAEVGKNINFGCGTVVCNYDGKEKHKTIIEDNAFIGCNTNLVAPVRVGEGAYTAAGSTITKDVPKNSLGIARAIQVNKDDWKRNK